MNEAERKVLESRFEAEMTVGYLDGRNPDNPPPSSNRSASYKHGFENGRDDHAHAPRATAALLRIMAVAAIQQDIEMAIGKPTKATSRGSIV